MKIVGLALQGIGPYEDKAIFKFKPGISVIYGLNRSSGKQSKNSNWVGKSLLFSTISEVLYEQPIVGSKQDRIAKGLQQVILQDDKNKYLISKKNNKYIIKVNGINKNFVTNKKGPREFIEQIWPLTLEEYETFVHIDTRIPHPLVMGSTAIRKEFFTKFFGLDKVDAERKLYLAELNKLASVKESYNTLYSTYNLIKKDSLSKEQITALEKEVENLHNQQDQLKVDMLKMQEKQQLIEFANAWKEEIDILKKNNIYNEDQLRELANKHQAEVEDYSKKKALAEKYHQYCLENEAYLNAYNKLSDKEKSISFDKAKEGHKRFLTASNNKEELELAIDKLKDLEEVNKPENINIDIDQISAQMILLKHQIEHAEKFKDGICPTCGQPVKNIDLNQLKSDYAKLKEQQSLYNQYQKELDSYNEYIKNKEQLESNQEEYAKNEQLANKYSKYEKLYKKLIALPDKPEPFIDSIYDLKDINNKRQDAQEKERFYRKLLPYANKIEAYFQLKDKTVDKSIFEKYNAASNKYYEMNTKLENAKTTYSKLEQIQSNLQSMKKQLEDVKPLEYLVDLFQDKTLKKRIVQIIGDRLMQLVNKYAALTFNEDYKFSLEWESSQINIICKRKAGKRELVSDVRKLSGAESRLFTLILVLSLLSFIPTNKRPNVLILDEPDANFSAETTAQFYKLIQIIEKAIESIIIITTRTDEMYAGSRCYTIVRDGNSKIVKGFPSEL